MADSQERREQRPQRVFSGIRGGRESRCTKRGVYIDCWESDCYFCLCELCICTNSFRSVDFQAEDDADLDDMLMEGWFDEELKAKLKRRRKEQQERSTMDPQTSKPQSIFEEIKELLKEEESMRGTRRQVKEEDVERERRYYKTTVGPREESTGTAPTCYNFDWYSQS